MKLKKIYCPPEIIEIKIDRELSLVMLSEYTPPDDPFPSNAPAQQQAETQQNNFKDNPFE